MKPIALVPLFLALFMVGCDSILPSDAAAALAGPGAAGPEVPVVDPQPGDAPAEGDEPETPVFAEATGHSYFPLAPGTFWTFQGEDDGEQRRDEVVVLAEPQLIAGVACTAIQQEVYLDGELVEVSVEWFAQDDVGNLWKFGEESHELDEDVGLFVRTDDSWVAGEDDMAPWMFFPAAPREGDLYVGFQPESEERMEVISLTTTATVPGGTYTDCLEVLETTVDIEDPDIVIYAPQVGVVSETSQTGHIELVTTGVR